MSDNTLESLGYKQELSRTLEVKDLVIYGLIFIRFYAGYLVLLVRGGRARRPQGDLDHATACPAPPVRLIEGVW